MKRIVVSGVVTLVFLTAFLVGQGLTWILTRRDDAADENLVWRPELAWKGNEVTVNGKKTRFDFPDAENVEVVHSKYFITSDEQVFVKMFVTIKREQPLVLTKQAYENIQTGMTYPQVGEALGGMMTQGQMSKGFCGDIEVVQGKRRIDLHWVNGKVINKSADGIE